MSNISCSRKKLSGLNIECCLDPVNIPEIFMNYCRERLNHFFNNVLQYNMVFPAPVFSATFALMTHSDSQGGKITKTVVSVIRLIILKAKRHSSIEKLPVVGDLTKRLLEWAIERGSPEFSVETFWLHELPRVDGVQETNMYHKNIDTYNQLSP